MSCLSGGTHGLYIKERVFTWGDSYELDIADPGDELIALAVVLTIDCVVEQQNDN